LLKEFESEALIVRDLGTPIITGDAIELLARHHGLPSPLSDWSQSPYVAAYFADQDAKGPRPATVWSFDRGTIPMAAAVPNDFEVNDDRSLLRFNRRALQQQSVFIRVNTIREPLEVLLIRGIQRFELDLGDRTLALADLDAMGISASTLFDDLDGVARTVRVRFP
jgi:hypothetical protein